MSKALLLYNPLSGGRHARRNAVVDAVVNVLQNAGLELTISQTGSSASAPEQARQAATQECDTVFVCGGDGTVHDVLQGLVGSQTALAVIPLGTGNVLAHDLGVPLNPVRAASAALTSQRRRISVGRIDFQNFQGVRSSRYFTVAAGIGVDAHLFYSLNTSIKTRLGMPAYYFQATWLWLTHRMTCFEVELSPTTGTYTKYRDVSDLLAVRPTKFGGLLRELAPGASLSRRDLQLVLFRTRNRLSYLAFVIRCMLGQRWNVAGVEAPSAQRVQCRTLSPTPRIYVETDGELVGTLPAEISMLQDALTILVPGPPADSARA